MRPLAILASGLVVAGAASALAAPAPAQAPTAKAPGPQVVFSRLLPDVPGKRLVVVPLTLPPRRDAQPHPHRHPGPVYVYVTRGVARLGVQGQPVQIVHAGESFFEPKGALHTVAESDSETEPAYAIAVMIVPDGAPLVLPPNDHAGR